MLISANAPLFGEALRGIGQVYRPNDKVQVAYYRHGDTGPSYSQATFIFKDSILSSVQIKLDGDESPTCFSFAPSSTNQLLAIGTSRADLRKLAYIHRPRPPQSTSSTHDVDEMTVFGKFLLEGHQHPVLFRRSGFHIIDFDLSLGNPMIHGVTLLLKKMRTSNFDPSLLKPDGWAHEEASFSLIGSCDYEAEDVQCVEATETGFDITHYQDSRSLYHNYSRQVLRSTHDYKANRTQHTDVTPEAMEALACIKHYLLREETKGHFEIIRQETETGSLTSVFCEGTLVLRGWLENKTPRVTIYTAKKEENRFRFITGNGTVVYLDALYD